MKLYVLSTYVNRNLKYQKGDVIENCSPELAEYLLSDSPSSFSKKKPASSKAMDAPVENKAVSRAPAKKDK